MDKNKKYPMHIIIIFFSSLLFQYTFSNETSTAVNYNETYSLDYNSTTNYSTTPNPILVTTFEVNASEITNNSSASTTASPTTVLAPNSPTTKPPKMKPTTFSNCPCDIFLSKCDFNCCCDTECSEEDRKLFLDCSENLPVQKHPTISDKYCIKKDYLFRDNTPYETTMTNKGLFCILSDNSKQETELILPKNLKNLEIIPKYSWPSQLQPSALKPAANRYNYKSGIEILEKNKTENGIQHFELPAFFYDKCTSQQLVQFLENFEADCVWNFVNIEKDCENLQTLDVHTYMDNFYFVGNPGLDKTINTTVWNKNLLNTSYFHCNETTKICSSVSELQRPKLDAKLRICINILKKLDITFVHNGTRGITSVSANITYTNLGLDDTNSVELFQGFKVNFKWNEDSLLQDDIPISGNPGYIIGKPLIIGIPAPKPEELVKNSSSEIEEDSDNKTVSRTLVQKDHSTGWHLSVPNPSNCNGLRKQVKFGMDIATSCFLNITYYKSCQELQVAVGKVLLGVEPKNFIPRYVSSFGIPDFTNLDDWVEIVSTEHPFGVDQTSSFTLLDNGCGGIVTRLKIKILHGLSGSIRFPQSRIAGILYEYGDPIKIPRKDNRQTSQIPVTTTVQFYDITGGTKTLIPKWPVITIKLPSDFFYPFSSIGTKSCQILASLLVACIFAAVILN